MWRHQNCKQAFSVDSGESLIYSKWRLPAPLHSASRMLSHLHVHASSPEQRHTGKAGRNKPEVLTQLVTLAVAVGEKPVVQQLQAGSNL